MNFAAVLERLAKLENPYPGLRPFETEEAHLFFGRDQQVLDLLDRLRRGRFVAVMGLSGSGKSSLVCAGSSSPLFSKGVCWSLDSVGVWPPRGRPERHSPASLRLWTAKPKIFAPAATD